LISDLKNRCKMDAVTGVFRSKETAEKAVQDLRSNGIHADKITLLTPGEHIKEEAATIPAESTEQPGMGKAIGALIGGAAGLSGGLVLAVIPGVGMVSAIGLLGAALLTAAGASVGAAAGEKAENSMTHGLPEDEIFVYEDALRKGRTVVVVLAEDESSAERVRNKLKDDGAEAVDAAREQWWIGLRGAENEHYSKSGREFRDDEKFYRVGFEAALHARTRCMEFDQVASEMAADVEELKKQYPDAEVEEPFTRGYERGRDHYQKLCDQSKAA
jgi:outer membrane lipoprotein SlyB